VGEAKERRKVLEQRVKEALGALSFRRQGSKDRYATQDWTEEPLQTVLFVGIDTDRYGTVRLGASAAIIVPAVEELLEGVPPTALSPAMEIYHGRIPVGVAGISFKKLLDPDRKTPLEWRVASDDDLEPAVDGFVQAVDGPLRDWAVRHATVDAVRAAVDHERGLPSEGITVRGVAVLEALQGDLPAALARLDRYRSAPTADDAPERVQAFADWLAGAVAPTAR
jgi:hypothetical protein